MLIWLASMLWPFMKFASYKEELQGFMGNRTAKVYSRPDSGALNILNSLSTGVIKACQMFFKMFLFKHFRHFDSNFDYTHIYQLI